MKVIVIIFISSLILSACGDGDKTPFFSYAGKITVHDPDLQLISSDEKIRPVRTGDVVVNFYNSRVELVQYANTIPLYFTSGLEADGAPSKKNKPEKIKIKSLDDFNAVGSKMSFHQDLKPTIYRRPELKSTDIGEVYERCVHHTDLDVDVSIGADGYPTTTVSSEDVYGSQLVRYKFFRYFDHYELKLFSTIDKHLVAEISGYIPRTEKQELFRGECFL